MTTTPTPTFMFSRIRTSALSLSLALGFVAACVPQKGETDTNASETDPSTATSDDPETDSSTGGSETETTAGSEATTATGGSESTSTSSTSSDPTSGSTGSSSDPSSGSSGSSTGVDVCDGVSEPIDGFQNGFAVFWGDIPDDSGGSSGSSGGSSGDPMDPEALLVNLANNFNETCQDPFGLGDCNGELLWSVSFTLQPDQQQPGVYDLDDLNGSQFATGPNGDLPDDCWFGGGSLSGWLVIDAVENGKIIGRLCDTSPSIDFNADGAFEATFCE